MGVTATRVVKFIRKGVGIAYTDVEYADSTSNSVAPTSGWQTTAPAWQNGHYIWQRIKFTYTDGNTAYSRPVCLSGGKGISSITEYYLATSASSGVTTATTGWTTAVQSVTASNKYLWNYEVVTYTDGTTTTTTPVIIGTYGDKGVGITSITEHYLATSASSGVTRSTTGWTTSIQTVTNTNKYLWNYETVTYTDGTTQDTDPVIIGVYGDAAIGYSISLADSIFAYDPNSQGDEMYVDIKGKVYKTVGGTTSPYTNLSRSELSLYFLKSDGTIDSIPNTNSLTGGFTVSGNTFATKYYNETGWADETVFVAVLTVGSSEVARESIQINKYGEQGSTGKGIQSVVTSYARSSVATTTNDTTAPAIDGSWTTAQPTLTDTYPYMWKKEVITWTNGTTTTRYTMIGQRGGPGSQGSRGPALRGPQAWSDLETNYQLYKGAEGEPYKDIVLYNGNYYTCIKTHTKTATNYPGSTYDTNNNLWQLSDKVEMIAANVMFAEHGFFGDAIISGQWLISANGTIDSTDYIKGQTFNGELAYDLFNADSPLGADISKYNNTSTTTISSSEATKNKDTVSLQAGKVYKINCVGYTSNASHPVYVRLVKTDNSSVYVTPINLNSASSVERYGYAHIVQTGNYYIQLYHDTGYTGTLTSCKIVEKCFAPKYALNLRSGKVYENDAHVKGNIYRPPFTINNSNYTTYAPKNSNDVYIIDLKKTGLNIQLDFTASGTILIDFPTGDEYLGAEITIVNSSNQDAYVETILWGEGDASFAISRYSGYAAFKYVKYTNAFGNTVARWWVTASIYDPGNC